MIHATAHSDDYAIECFFDATEYFTEADANEIVSLGLQEWGGCLEADQVAIFMADRGAEYDPRSASLSSLFAYLPGPVEDYSGFECYVDREDALAWLREHRPDVWVQVRSEG